MNNKLMMQSLPLVAAVLGKKYGVNVAIGGDKAFTDGKTIQLPGLSLDNDETLIGLARGYIDHESAHIRETDFDLLRKARLTPLEMNIWNNLEDWRVEHKLADIFPGCRRNFNWLIRHFFGAKNMDEQIPPVNLIPDWVLLTVRSWDMDDITQSMEKIEPIIETHYPGLIERLKSILQEVRTKCLTTDDSIFYAKKIVSLLENMAKEKSPSGLPQNKGGTSSENGKSADPEQVSREVENGNHQRSNSQKQLEQLINASSNDLPKNMGDVLAEDLAKRVPDNPQEMIRVAVVGNRMFKAFTPEKLQETRKSSSALKTRLQSMMQAMLLKRSRIARQGRLATNLLHKITVSDPRMFIQHEEKQGFNTAVHILIDCSGSMINRMDLTTMACHALAKALESVKGINVGVTAFPAKPPFCIVSGNDDMAAVCPMVIHGEPLHSQFHTKASDCTPMGEATWWVLQQMLPLKESRKIILILTDGAPDCLASMKDAIEHGRKLGVEFYGIGIDDNTIKVMLPHHSCTIRNLSELAPAMFGIMKNVFIDKNQK